MNQLETQGDNIKNKNNLLRAREEPGEKPNNNRIRRSRVTFLCFVPLGEQSTEYDAVGPEASLQVVENGAGEINNLFGMITAPQRKINKAKLNHFLKQNKTFIIYVIYYLHTLSNQM